MVSAAAGVEEGRRLASGAGEESRARPVQPPDLIEGSGFCPRYRVLRHENTTKAKKF